MKNLLFASAAALGLAAAPVMAQVTSDAPLGSTNSVADKRADMSPEQQAMYDELTPEYRAVFNRLTPDRQTMYFGWDAALRDYYWTLDNMQQNVWFDLSRIQQISLYQRDIAWTSVMDRPEAQHASTTRDYATSTTTQITYQSNPMVQNVDMTRPATYPICESDADDSCINAWAAGMRGPGVDRPLAYFPENRRGG